MLRRSFLKALAAVPAMAGFFLPGRRESGREAAGAVPEAQNRYAMAEMWPDTKLVGSEPLVARIRVHGQIRPGDSVWYDPSARAFVAMKDNAGLREAVVLSVAIHPIGK